MGLLVNIKVPYSSVQSTDRKEQIDYVKVLVKIMIIICNNSENKPLTISGKNWINSKFTAIIYKFWFAFLVAP